MEITLRAYSNPDRPGRHFLPKKETVTVESLTEARDIFREWIRANDLGGGNVGITKITQNGTLVAYISYNGRVWTTEKDWKNRREIELGGSK